MFHCVIIMYSVYVSSRSGVY